MGTSLLHTGDIARGRAHLDRAIALYDPAEHHSLTARFGQDTRVTVLSWRALALWLLGYPEAARADASRALKDAREIGQASTLMFTLAHTSYTHICCGDYDTANAHFDEVVRLSDQKGAPFWKTYAMLLQGCLLSLTGKSSNAVALITSEVAVYRSTGATLSIPWHLSFLSRAYADLGRFEDAWRCIGEAVTAMEATRERWCETDVHRMAGEIALMSPSPDAVKAEAHFDHALAIARAQQAKSWELRAAMSMARVWRDQRKRQQAYDLLAPVYGRFTEGFDTLDLKQAKVLLDELA
jgi:predicted ATPase